MAIGAVAGVAVTFVEVHLGMLGHGTHLLLFLLVVVAIRLPLGSGPAWTALVVGAIGSAAASAAGLGPADPPLKVATQLALFGVLGGITLGVLWRVPARQAAQMAAAPVRERTVDPLTARELEVLRLAATGMPIKEIAAATYLSPNTVKTHLAHAYDKLAAHNRAEAVRSALHCGCLTSADLCPHQYVQGENRPHG